MRAPAMPTYEQAKEKVRAERGGQHERAAASVALNGDNHERNVQQVVEKRYHRCSGSTGAFTMTHTQAHGMMQVAGAEQRVLAVCAWE